MDKLERIDLLLGEALECMVEAAGELKTVENINQKKKTLRIGRAICELWEVRDEIYKIKPEIKRDFVKEQEEDKQRYDELDKIFHEAWSAENKADKKSAITYYKELLQKSKSGYFTLLAQAGLYRLSKS